MNQANWYPDPSGRYVQRYFDGARWTQWVVDTQGSQGTDPTPIETAPPPPSGMPAPYGAGYATHGYGYNPYADYAPQGSNGMAIASLILGIVGLPLFVFVIPSLLAVIFGFVGRSQMRSSGQSGRGMATAGIILGFFGLAFFALIVVVAAIDTADDTTLSLAARL